MPRREWLFEMRPTIQATGLTTWLMTLPLLALGHRYITRERTFYKVDGKSLIGSVTAKMEVKNSFDCSHLCLKYGPVPCLSFNLERSNNSIHTCELSSSEKYLEPQKVQERTGYDYYGTEYDVGRPILPNLVVSIKWAWVKSSLQLDSKSRNQKSTWKSELEG